MLWGFMPLLRIMNSGVFTMNLFDDYVKFCAKVEGQRVTLTFDTHVTSYIYFIANTKLEFTGYNSFKKITIFSFSHTKVYATKFDLDVNWIKFKPVIIEIWLQMAQWFLRKTSFNFHI